MKSEVMTGVAISGEFENESPLGLAGSLVGLCFMRGDLRRLLAARSRAIKLEAESNGFEFAGP